MAAKKKGGLWRGFIVFLLGVTCGTGSIALVAAYVNELHLPFIQKEGKTRLPHLSGEGARSQREAVEFQDILRQQQPLPIAEEELPSTAAPERRLDYYLQVGAFTSKEVADNLRGELLLNGDPSIIKAGTLADGSPLYRVWVGPYKDQDSAEQQRAQMVLAGYADVQLLQAAQ